MNLDIAILIGYLILLVLIGVVFSRFNRDVSDYIRGGARGAWWMVGSSMLIAGISAYTFTGGASAAFEAGPTVLVIYAANCAGYAASALVVGPWFRQTRAHTIADIYKERFGTEVEQFQAITGALLGPFGAAINLWALALFTGSVFDFPILPTIVVIGSIVVLYSTVGGRWAVMATDFAQSLIIYGMTIIVFCLSLYKIGGIGEFFSFFTDERFAGDFKFAKEPGEFPANRFTWHWAIIIFFMNFYYHISLVTGHRFLALKDGNEARKASWLAFVLMAFGTAIWFLPPMVARFLYESEILALDIENPSNASYAYLAEQLLPNGMLGLMVAAMFAASMSNMDTGLNNQTGIIVHNLIPWIRRLFKLAPRDDKHDLFLCKVVTLILGVIVITFAIGLHLQKDFPLFDAYFMLGTLIGIPIGLPLFVALWVKRMPRWSYFCIFGVSLLPSLYSLYDQYANDNRWTVQDRAMWVFIFGIIGTLICRALYFTTSESYKRRVQAFFTKMHTPVDFEKEIGKGNDRSQCWTVAVISYSMGALIALLALVPNELWGRLLYLGLAAFMASIGFLLQREARKHSD